LQLQDRHNGAFKQMLSCTVTVNKVCAKTRTQERVLLCVDHGAHDVDHVRMLQFKHDPHLMDEVASEFLPRGDLAPSWEAYAPAQTCTSCQILATKPRCESGCFSAQQWTRVGNTLKFCSASVGKAHRWYTQTMSCFKSLHLSDAHNQSRFIFGGCVIFGVEAGIVGWLFLTSSYVHSSCMPFTTPS